MSNYSPEQLEVAQIARDYFDLTSTPGWKRIAGFMERYVGGALDAIRTNNEVDKDMAFALHLAWRERANFADAITAEIQEAIAARKEMVRESLDSQGLDASTVDSFIESEDFNG